MRHRLAPKRVLATATLAAALSLSGAVSTSVVALAAGETTPPPFGATTPATPATPPAAPPAFDATAPAPATPAPSASVPAVTVAPAIAPPAAPTPAPAVSAEGAAQLAKFLDERLKSYLGTLTDGAKVQLSGPTMAVVDGDHYAVSLPVIRFDGDDKGSHFEIPGVSMTVKPLANEEFALTIKLPSSMTALEKGAPVATLTVGSNDISGVWAARFENFVSANVAVKDIRLQANQDDMVMTIGAINATEDLKPDPAGGYSGPMAMALSDLRIEEEEQAIFTVGAVTWESIYTRLRMERGVELNRLAEAVAEKKAEPDPAKFLSLVEGLFGGASMRVRIDDMMVSDYDEKTEEETVVTLGRLGFHGGIDDFDKEKAKLAFGFEVNGIGIDPAPVNDSMMPLGTDLTISLRDIPSKRLLGLAQSLLTPGAAATAAPPAIPALMDVLTNAGLTLEIEKGGVKLPLGGVEAAGSVRASAQAAMGGEGEVTFRVRGLDAMMESMKPADGGKPDKETGEILGGLTMLKAMGRPETKPGGVTEMVYAIKLTPQGTFLLNGTDMGPLLGMQ